MFRASVLLAFSLAAVVYGQQAGTQTPETHPTLSSQKCTTSGGCVNQDTSVVLDGNWRWLHDVTGYTNCYTGNEWDATLCPDGTTCAQNCALDGAEYESTYGITSSDDSLTLQFVTGSNVGSRVYLMSSETEYTLFQLLNQEFTFTVDVSQLPCGLNGALYLSEMDADGGLSRFPTNKAGAKYGTGYCDSQCPQDIKFINGIANVEGWNATSANAGTGSMGTCCSEMDIWEANSVSAAFTPHPCETTGQTECTGSDCTRDTGLCDADGCDFNSYRLGNTTFYGASQTVDTTKPFTVVTQFLTSDNTTTGTLSEIRRLYIQNDVVIQNSNVNIPGIDAVNSITEDFCAQQKEVFGDTNYFDQHGGLAQLGESLDTGMVLALSIWDDYTASMLWLDSDYPTTKSASSAGVARGTCASTSGVPSQVESQSPNAQVVFSAIKWGDIGSTFTGSSGTVPPPPPSGSASSAGTQPTQPSTGSAVPQWGQCGGIGFAGSTTCASGFSCHVVNPYYSQCY
jgi:cellulose 1,4-beta-cellobiosidase